MVIYSFLFIPKPLQVYPNSCFSLSFQALVLRVNYLFYTNKPYAYLKCLSEFFFKKNIFIDYAITVVPFPAPLTPLHPAHALLPTFPPYSSCPWVILISSLASTFPTLFLPSPCLFSTYHLCYLFSVPLPPSPPPTPLLTTLMF